MAFRSLVVPSKESRQYKDFHEYKHLSKYHKYQLSKKEECDKLLECEKREKQKKDEDEKKEAKEKHDKEVEDKKKEYEEYTKKQKERRKKCKEYEKYELVQIYDMVVEFRSKLCNNHRIRDDIKYFVKGLYQEEFDKLYDMFYYRFRDIDDDDKIKKKAVKIIDELDYKNLD
jgi:hypothetical protein